MNHIFRKAAVERWSKEMSITSPRTEGKIGRPYLYMIRGEFICRKEALSDTSSNIYFYWISSFAYGNKGIQLLQNISYFNDLILVLEKQCIHLTDCPHGWLVHLTDCLANVPSTWPSTWPMGHPC
jgi:hypothetical protein